MNMSMNFSWTLIWRCQIDWIIFTSWRRKRQIVDHWKSIGTREWVSRFNTQRKYELSMSLDSIYTHISRLGHWIVDLNVFFFVIVLSLPWRIREEEWTKQKKNLHIFISHCVALWRCKSNKPSQWHKNVQLYLCICV